MGFVERNLLPQEEVQHRSRTHWMFIASRVVFLFMVTGPLLAMHAHMIWVGLAGFVALIFLLDALVYRWTTEMAVTTMRVILKTGLIARRTTELRLSKVEAIHVKQGVVGRLLGFGTLHVVGAGGTNERLLWVSDPLSFRNATTRLADAAENPK